MTGNTQSLWRVDTHYLTCKQVQVSEEAPLKKWLNPLFGEGMYIYVKTEQEAKELLKNVIEDKIKNLNKMLDELK